VATNRIGGYRNDLAVALTGLDVEAKAAAVEAAFWGACAHDPADFAQVTTRLDRTDKIDPATNVEAVAVWRLSVLDPDKAKVGRAFSNASVEIALATIPGYFPLGGAPSDAAEFGVYRPALVPAASVPQHVHLIDDDGGATTIESAIDPGSAVVVEPAPGPDADVPGGPTVRAPLGRVVGARSGDKGGHANLGVFARTDEAWAWLDGFLTVERLRELLPEVDGLEVERHRLPSLRSLNFLVRGLLGEGVAASTRDDRQAKGLGEWLRARVVEVPASLLGEDSGDVPR
jgi:hypothetical protein